MPPAAPIATVAVTRASCQASPTADLGRRLLARAAEDCGASEATLWLLSADRATLDGALNHGKTPQVLESLSVPITKSVVGMVASTGVAASIGPEDYHNPAPRERGAAATLAMIAAPLYVQGKLTGVVSAINPRDGDIFSGEDLAALSFNAYLLGLVLADTHAL